MDYKLKVDENGMVGKDIPFERIRRITGYLVGDLNRFNDGKLACLGAAKDGTGYDIRDGKYKFITKDTNSLNKYNIEFKEDNAILTINNNKFLIPLDILTYSNSDFTNRIETYRIGNAIEKQLAMRKKDIPK